MLSDQKYKENSIYLTCCGMLIKHNGKFSGSRARKASAWLPHVEIDKKALDAYSRRGRVGIYDSRGIRGR